MHRLSLIFVVLLVLLAVAGAAPPRAAETHGGKLAVRAAAGPYRVEASVSLTGGMVDETASITDGATGRPVTGALVALTLRDSDGQALGPFAAQATGGLYEARYPRQRRDAGWRVTITVTGRLGQGEASHAYVEPGDGIGGFGLTVLAGILLLVMPVIAWRAWFREPPARVEAASPGGDDAPPET